MIEPIAILYRLGPKKWTTGRGGVRRQMIELLPLGEKERGEEPEDGVATEKEREVARPCARKNCKNEIPSGRLAKGAKFCSVDCQKRDCKQRWQKKTYKSPQVRKPGHTEFVGEG